MTNSNSIISLGDLSKPATVLIEKISEAIENIFKPWQIKRIALAEVEAERIKVLSDIELTEKQYRAISRLIEEESIKQVNIETITIQAIGQLTPEAKPENIERDWLVHFFEKSRLISDNDMQTLWAKLLAGESNNTGSYSIRTID